MRQHCHAPPLKRWLGEGLILASLWLVAARCSDDDSPPAELQVQCGSGKTVEVQCVPPGQIVQGSKLPATWDLNNCQVRAEVKNSCCLPAQAGPVLRDGMCCYAFCAGSCC